MKLGKNHSNRVSVVIDGDHLMHRHLHQPGFRVLASPKGVPTGLTMGVLQQLNLMFQRLDGGEIDSIYFVVGGGSCKWRKAIYPEYKWKSPEKKAEFREIQKGEKWSSADIMNHSRTLLKTILPSLGIKILSHPHHEADEIAYFLASRLLMIGRDCVALSDDGDWLQFVQHLDVPVYRALKDDKIVEENFEEKTGVPLKAFTLYISLLGGHDNIPGALKGFGSKSIQKMLPELTSYTPEAIKEWALKQTGKVRPLLAEKTVLDQIELNLSLVDFRLAPLTQEIKDNIDSTIKRKSQYDLTLANEFFDEHAFDQLKEYMDLGMFSILR